MKKQNVDTNYLDKIPVRNESIKWSSDEDNKVTLEIENKGVFNKIAQLLFKKPKVSYVHLDNMGSFVWPLIDGKKDITALGLDVYNHFGEEAEPLYERLSKYFQILYSYGFISWEK